MQVYLTVNEFSQYFPHSQLNSQQIEMAFFEAATILHNWLGYSPIPQDYQEDVTSDINGNITLSNYPVIKVSEIIALPPTTLPVHYSEQEVKWMWRFHDRRLFTYLTKCLFRIRYEAGYKPLPDIFKLTFINLLKKAATNADFDFSKLYNPAKEVTSLSIGGLSQSFRLGNLKNVNTELDKILQPISRYKRRILT